MRSERFEIYITKRLRERVFEESKVCSIPISRYMKSVVFDWLFVDNDFTDTDDAEEIIWRYRKDERVVCPTPREVRIAIYFSPKEWVIVNKLSSFMRDMPIGYRAISMLLT